MAERSPFDWSYKAQLMYAITRHPEIRRGSGSTAAVASVLVDRMNRRTGLCNPGMASIVRDSGVPRTTAIAAVKLLERTGLLVVNRSGFTNSYVFNTSPENGTSATLGTSATQNLKRGSSSATTGTEVVPAPEPKQVVKNKSNKSRSTKGEPSALFRIMSGAYSKWLPKCRLVVYTPTLDKRMSKVEELAKACCQQVGIAYEPEHFWDVYFSCCADDPWMRGDIANPNNPRWKPSLNLLIDDKRFDQVIATSLMEES